MEGGTPYPRLIDAGEVPLWRRLLARLGIPTVLFWDEKHFKAPTPIYVAWCERHNVFFLDYPHGYSGRLDCPICLKIWKEAMNKAGEQG